ncbi:hypothetical protein B0I35DRAFT_447688 [Stachybotrys elegans]|uniref:Uncharacterized protein n=1 Tax=Stachybotrys elegans TaxID=80388 RepID=A0A8K0S9Y5_9HYPO|nr:hypothetical protein B0I35DRAFT_447688 [Stachybotrys elegans]
MIAIIYPFSVAISKEHWLKWIAICETIEAMLIIIFAMVSRISTSMELACIVPFTSQASAIGIILFASRGISSKRVPKHTADHLSLLAFLLLLLSGLLLGLSLAGYYERLMLTQWLLYITISTVGYRLPERAPNSYQAGDSEIELHTNHQQNLSHSLPESPSSPNVGSH